MSDLVRDMDQNKMTASSDLLNSLGVYVFLFFILVIAYWSVLSAMVGTWWRSDTFAHGFLIFPISIFLVWQNRSTLYSAEIKPSTRVSVLLAGLVMLWLVAFLADIMVLQQLAVVAMIPTILWQLVGKVAVKRIMFPLLFLFFAVPVGEFLVPILQDLTAHFTVSALRLSGIPVYMEGRFFYIPSGSFEVAEACSGVRYLIASLALGTLFSYITYRSYKRRLLFILLSVIVPILANGVRAYGIVLLAHYSDYKLAVGVDHFIYGWVFFGIIIFALFWIGSRFSDQPQKNNPTEIAQADSQLKGELSIKKLVPNTVVIICIVASGPLVATVLSAKTAAALENRQLRLDVSSWRPVEMSSNTWNPEFLGADNSLFISLAKEDMSVQVYMAQYINQSQGRELINSENRIYDPEKWRRVSDQLVMVELNGQPWEVQEIVLKTGSHFRLVWAWYEIGGIATTSQYSAKLLEIRKKLLMKSAASNVVLVSASASDDSELAKNVLRQFLAEELEQIRGALNAVTS